MGIAPSHQTVVLEKKLRPNCSLIEFSDAICPQFPAAPNVWLAQ